MKRFAMRATRIALAPTLGLAITLALIPSRAELLVHVWLLVLLVSLGLAGLGALRQAFPRGPSPFDRRPTRRATPGRFPSLERIEREVALAATSAHDVHFRLRPTVRAVTAQLLSAGRGVNLDGSPAQARELLGAETWGLVRADREAPSDPRGPGLDRDTIERIVTRLETLAPREGLMDLAEVRVNGNHILDEIEHAVVGKRDVLELMLMGLLADGHVLLEDVPGLAKTLAARSFAAVTSLGFSRVQFTPDLLPSDVTGSSIWNQRDADFEFRSGPIFANLLLADEINRAPPKTQAALLEAMQERQVTVDGTTHMLERPFLVLATQNPIEYEGTYPLPEAQLDRFLLKTAFGYPSADDEWEMLARRIARRVDEVELKPVVDRMTLLAMQAAVEDVHVGVDVGRYAVALVRGTRESASVAVGSSPRGSLALLKLSRCRAALAGRDFVTPDDVKAVAQPALGHRLVLKPELWVQRRTGADVVQEVLDSVPTPPAATPGAP